MIISIVIFYHKSDGGSIETWQLSFGSRLAKVLTSWVRELDLRTICQAKPEEVCSWKQGVGGEIFMEVKAF